MILKNLLFSSATNLSNMPRVSSVSKTSLKAKNASFSSGEKESSQSAIKCSYFVNISCVGVVIND